MFKKRKSRTKTKKTSSILDEPITTTTTADSITDSTSSSTLQCSILAATRAEQAERTKRRSSSTVIVSGDGQAQVKRRRVTTSTLLTKQHEAAVKKDPKEDKHLTEYIAQRMGKEMESSSSSSSSSSTNEPKEEDPYDLLKRGAKHLTAEQGGQSEIAGSGMAGIGIYEVDLPADTVEQNKAATKQAEAISKLNKGHYSRLAGLKLPSSFSGNFVASGHLINRGVCVTMPDGSHLKSKKANKTRATDFKMMKDFRNSSHR